MDGVYTLNSAFNKYRKPALYLFFGVMAATSLLLIPIQDYREYINQWQLIMSGDNPWKYLGENRTNTYGPLHALMAPLAALYPYLPRLLTTLSGIWIFYLISGERDIEPVSKSALFLYLLNPFIWITCTIIGHNDVFVALLCLLAFHQFKKQEYIVTGLLLALGVCYKIYPVIFVPFLVVQNRRINWKLLASFVISLLALLGLTYLLWRGDFFFSFTYNTTRISKFLSIFRFLRGDVFPFGDSLDQYSVLVVAVSQLLLFGWYLIKSPDARKAGIISFLLLLLFYKVGHPQFHFVAIVLLAAFINEYRIWDRDKKLFLAVGIYVGWLSAIAIIDHLVTVTGFSNYLIREYAGLVHTGIMGYLIYRLIQFPENRHLYDEPEGS